MPPSSLTPPECTLTCTRCLPANESMLTSYRPSRAPPLRVREEGGMATATVSWRVRNEGTRGGTVACAPRLHRNATVFGEEGIQGGCGAVASGREQQQA